MNFGDCPYDNCDGLLTVAVPEKTPAYVQIECPTCKRPVWYRISRFDPMAWTKEEFEREHVIDYDTNTIESRAAAQNAGNGTGGT